MKIFESSDALNQALLKNRGSKAELARILNRDKKTIQKVIDENNHGSKYYAVISAYAEEGDHAARQVARKNGLLNLPYIPV